MYIKAETVHIRLPQHEAQFDLFPPNSSLTGPGRDILANNLTSIQTDLLQKLVQLLFSGGGEKLSLYEHLHFTSYVENSV
jgi:hypothetical protein